LKTIEEIKNNVGTILEWKFSGCGDNARLPSRSLRHTAREGGLLRSRPDPVSSQAVAQV